MPEIVLSTFLEKVITNQDELCRLGEDNLPTFETEIDDLRRFLGDTERENRMLDVANETVVDATNIACEAEDLIDIFIRRIEVKRKIMSSIEAPDVSYKPEDGRIDTFIRFCKEQTKKFSSLGKESEKLENDMKNIVNEFGKRIKELVSMVKKITDLPDCPSDSGHWSMEINESDPATMKVPDIVGLEEQKEKLFEHIKHPHPGFQDISIAGKRGVGKTTLARSFYTHRDAINHFDIRVWICVCPEYKAKDLLLGILKQVMEVDIKKELSRFCSGDFLETHRVQVRGNMQHEEVSRLKKLKVEKLKKKVKEQLEGKKYLVVIDMLRSTLWDIIKDSFPIQEGSILLMTACDQDEPSSSEKQNVLKLKFLDENDENKSWKESWDLLSRMVPNEVVPQPPTGLLTKCGGCPLAIIAVGGHLIGKTETSKAWLEKFNDGWGKQNEDPCNFILDIVYADLPYCLKTCFLYLSLFPVDHKINAEKLILLWVAEGFVKPGEERTMEDVAKGCLHELLQRSLIQVEKSKYHEGPVESFRVRDSVRDLYENRKNIVASRRCAVERSINTNAKRRDTEIRSLLAFNEKYGIERCMYKRVKCLKMLRVLDLEGVDLGSGANLYCAGLVHLRYLGIKNTKATELPESIWEMENLQTVDARGMGPKTKNSTFYMDKWRNTTRARPHLHSQPDEGPYVPENIWAMKQLRHIYLDRGYWSSLEDSSIAEEDFPKDLLTLHVSALIWLELVDRKLSTFFKSLRSLAILGDLTTRKQSNDPIRSGCLPDSLRELILDNSGLKDDPSSVLGNLPELRVLQISMGAYTGGKMHFSASAFKKLEFLQIIQLDNLKTWTVDPGALAKLKHLEINECEKLEMLPEELKNVETIKKIEMLSMSEEFKTIASSPNGKDWHKIQHIPFITLTSK